jgi:hypothetical protein
MLPLDSPRWSELTDAYCPAWNIPALLSNLQALPAYEGHEADPISHSGVGRR